MSDYKRTRDESNAPGTPVPDPTDKKATETDDQSRRDGGEPANNEPVSKKQIEKIEEKAIDHTKDEPGS